MLLDAFKGVMINRFEGNFSGLNTNETTQLQHVVNLECGFSPDSKYVIQGSANPR